MKQSTMLAMILAGGRGTRLHDLTKKVAKPAVFFGGKYRIIDFPLSNCANSGIDIVGVLTQYESVLLNSYVASGQRWGLDTNNSAVYVLPPREKEDADLDEYRGTADAISQNIDFIDAMNPEYVLILSGDHIYKMDYAKMLAYHQACGADATIAVIEVPINEASRFGIMKVDDTKRIIAFEEKPQYPTSTLASMGIYIFDWKLLKNVLLEDKNNPNSSHDFGKDIIPHMIQQDKRLYAYTFHGYWKDVGTIHSLWEANMDLLDEKHALALSDPNWKIYTEDVSSIPHYIGGDAKIKQTWVTQGCVIEGSVDHSVLFTNTKIGKDAKVNNSVLMPGVEVEEGAIVDHVLVASGVKIEAGCVVRSENQEDVTLIAKDVKGGKLHE